MNKKFTKLIAALALLVFMAPSMVGWGQTRTTTYKLVQVTSVEANGLYVFEQSGHVMNNSISSSALETTDSYNTTGLIGTETYVWTLETATNGFYMKNVSVSKYMNNGSSGTISLANSGSSDWTFTFQTNSTVTIKNSSNSNRYLGYQSATTYKYKTYSSSGYPSAIKVYQLVPEGTPCDLALTGAPVTLNFDLYNNNTAQTINYTTSSTGAVTVEASEYVTTSVNATNKTITVTPTAVTPSAQTITVNQEADATFTAGSTSFTVNITNSTPSITITGTGITNNAVSIAYNDTESHAATVTYNNMSDPASNAVSVKLYDDDACTTIFNGGWLSANFANNSVTSINYTAVANTTAAQRTVYMRVETTNGGTELVPCNVIAITQAGRPTYTVTYVANGGTGTMTDSNSPYFDGVEVTLLANTFGAPAHMEWVSWSVKDASNNDVTVSNGKFTMPASNVTVTAQWTPITHTATFSVNGYTTSEVVAESAAIPFPTNPASIGGKTFVGWVATAIDTPTDETPTFVPTSTTMSTSDVTYYACFAEGSITPASLTKMKSNDDFEANDKVVIVADDGENEYAMYQETVSSSYVNKWSFVNNVTNVAADDKNWLTVSAGATSGTWKLGDATNGYVYNNSSNNLKIDTENSTDFTLAWNNDNLGFTLIGNDRWLSYRSDLSTNNYFRMGGSTIGTTSNPNPTPSGVAYFDIYKYVPESGSYYGYCTTIVIGTKEITGYNNGGGWNLIVSPLANAIAPDQVTEFTDNDFAFYRFNQEADLEWENWKQEGDHYHFKLEPGRGYLYANSEDVTLTFTGIPYTGSGEVELTKSDNYVEFAGLNLVGNPFTANANINGAPFYRMNEFGSEIVLAEEATILPLEGIFVCASEDGEMLTFTPASDPDSDGKGLLGVNLTHVDNYRGRNCLIDRAIVRFDEGRQMPKFQINKNSTKVYIPQDGKDYAVACAEAQGELPLNFRANENGQYTLTVNPEGIEMNYLHLIDNMTGANVDLLSTPSYTFTAKTTDYESRFRLVFASNGTSTSSATEETFAFFSNGNLVVNNEGEATLQVIDVMGRVLSSQTISGTAELNLNQQTGVYVLRLVNGNDVKTQKIVVK